MSQAGIISVNNIPPPPGSVLDLKGNDGISVGPDGSGVINVLGETLYTTRGNAGSHTLFIDPRVNAYPITPFVVGTVGSAGYQTIQAGINAANAAGGGVVYIQPGTYTENLTLFDKVDLYGTPAVSQNQGASTSIIGQHTPPISGHIGFNSIYFQNTSHIFNSAAAGTTHIVFLNCESAVQNGYFLNLPNWTGIFEFWDNNPSAAGAPFAVNDGGINNSSGATLFAFDCGIGFGTNVMALSGVVFGTGINFSCPINFGTGSNITLDDCQFAGQVTFSGNATGNICTSRFTGGSNPSITMSSSASVKIASAIVDSSNNPAISGAGAGTLTYSDLVFLNNAAFAGTLTLATVSWQPYSRAIAATDGTKVGTCAFNSSHFSVDATGFVTLAGGGQAIDSIGTQTGTNPIAPTAAGLVTINGATVAAGTNPVRTDGTGANTMAVEVQISQAIAATDATKIGLCNFNSSQFSVDANGFVSTNGNTVNWQSISANQTLVKNTGYFCISPGGALSLALPSTASSTIGDIIEITLDGATSWTITQAASQQIRFGNLQTTSGVGGSLASTAAGDTLRMVYQSSGKWNVLSSVGNLTIA